MRTDSFIQPIIPTFSHNNLLTMYSRIDGMYGITNLATLTWPTEKRKLVYHEHAISQENNTLVAHVNRFKGQHCHLYCNISATNE